MPLTHFRKFVAEHGNKGLVQPSEAQLDAAVGALREALVGQFKAHKSYYPRASKLFYPARRMWYMKRFPDEAEPTTAEKQATFFTGHALEAWFMLWLQLAAPSGKFQVRDAQAKGELKLGGEVIRGTIDLVIEEDGQAPKVWDVKTTNDEHFGTKWQSFDTLVANDSYGYIEQAAVYAASRGMDFGGWIVINKDKGDFKLVDVPEDGFLIFEQALANIEEKLVLAQKDEIPPLCYEPFQEVSKGELTGNVRVALACARCPYVEKCFPNAIKARRGQQPIYFLTLKNRANNVKIIHAEPENE